MLLFIACCALYYNHFLQQPYFSILKVLLVILFFLINSYLLDSQTQTKKNYGSFIFTGAFMLISFITTLSNKSFQMSLLIFYMILAFSTLFGHLLQKRKKEK